MARSERRCLWRVLGTVFSESIMLFMILVKVWFRSILAKSREEKKIRKSSLDAEVASKLQVKPSPQYPNLLRWSNHLSSFTAVEKQKFPKSKIELSDVCKMVVAENILSS